MATLSPLPGERGFASLQRGPDISPMPTSPATPLLPNQRKRTDARTMSNPSYAIDPPGRYASRAEWWAFLRRLGDLDPNDPAV